MTNFLNIPKSHKFQASQHNYIKLTGRAQTLKPDYFDSIRFAKKIKKGFKISPYSYRLTDYLEIHFIIPLNISKPHEFQNQFIQSLSKNYDIRQKKRNPDKEQAKAMWNRRMRSDGAEELREVGFGIGVHADDDDEGYKAVVGDDLRLLRRPVGPLLQELRRRWLLLLRALVRRRLPLRLQTNPRRHSSFFQVPLFVSSLSLSLKP